MKIAIRTDASIDIGTGHVMRCLTLAEYLRNGGAECLFVCREQLGNMIDQIRTRGFAVTSLPYCSDNSIDAEQSKLGIGKTLLDWLVVDHYSLDERWERQMRSTCRNLMAIDDLANRPHDCDLLLDQNLGRDAGDYNRFVPTGCRVLAGPRYALLRPQFAALRDYSLSRRILPKLRHLLIMMGGVDKDNATGRVLETIGKSALSADIRITVVMGPHAPWLQYIRLLASRMEQHTRVEVDVQNMAQLMADSDLAIGAGGISSWERCCLGLPALIVVLAPNQLVGATALDMSGCAKIIRDLDAIDPCLPSILGQLAADGELLRLSEASASVTDGRGANRVGLAIAGCHD